MRKVWAMQKAFIVGLTFLLSACANAAAIDPDSRIFYSSASGQSLWFENPGTTAMVICEGHSCFSLGQTYCDDSDYYCISHGGINVLIPKNLLNIVPALVSDKFGEENVWRKDGYVYEVIPRAGGRIIPTVSRYRSEISVFGTKIEGYFIVTRKEGSERYETNVFYSPEFGILSIEATYGSEQGEVYESYWLAGECGYLAHSPKCNE